MLDHLLRMSFRSILPCERAWRAEPTATRRALYFISFYDNKSIPAGFLQALLELSVPTVVQSVEHQRVYYMVPTDWKNSLP